MHSDGYLSSDEVRAIEEDLMMHGSEQPPEQLNWSVFAGVIAILLPIKPMDSFVLSVANGRLLAGGAIVTTTENSKYANRITHVVVVGTPEIELDMVLAALPVAETTSARQNRKRKPDVTWVVVSNLWVEAVFKREAELPPPLLKQQD
jgi:hypothetical protein